MDNSEFRDVPDEGIVEFPYLDREEAMFLLGRIRDSIECSLCPRWSRGCGANHTRAEMMGIPLKHFVENQVPGTEGHMCAKLRTIVNLSEAELQAVHRSYDLMMRKKIGYLDRVDGRIGYRNLGLEQQLRDIESKLTDKLNASKDYYEKQIAIIRLEANRKVEESMRIQAQYGYLIDRATEIETSYEEMKNLRQEVERLRAENEQLKNNQPPSP